jgi:predicted porin
MKPRVSSCVSAVMLCAASYAHADASSVTLYGVLDESLQYVNNTDNQHTQLGLQSGQMSISQWGIKGTEDLGGGLQTLFRLESGIDINSGKSNGDSLFGRKAYVGLSSPTWGTITFGRQIDVMQDLVVPVQGDNFLEYFTAPGDVDMADGVIHISNAVKWASPVWSGLQIESMYSFGGVAGSVMSGSTVSAAANYSNGPLTLAAGFFHEDNGNPSLSQRGTTSTDSLFFSPVNEAYASAARFNIARAGASYAIGPVTLGGYYSYSEYLPDASSSFRTAERYNNGSIFAYWQIDPSWAIEAGYDYLKSHGDSAATYQQATLAADYALSKRTDLYASASYGHAAGNDGMGAAQAVIADSYPAPGNQDQELAMIGIRHKF